MEAAIRVCRQAGFHTHAVQLAAAHAQHNLYVLIQVEDLKKYKDALLYIEKLSFDEVRESLGHDVNHSGRQGGGGVGHHT